MGEKIYFEIYTKPVSKERPRISRYSRRAYTPKKTKNFENEVAWAFNNKYRSFKPYDGEIHARIIAIFEVPKSYSKKKRELLLPNGTREHGAGYKGRQDFDNIGKAVCDALNGIAYVDDSQITTCLVRKEYGYSDKIIVELEEVGKFI